MALPWVPVLLAGIIVFALAVTLAVRGVRNVSAWMAVLVLLGHAELMLLAGYLGDRPVTDLYRPGRWFIQAVALGAEFALVAAWPSNPLVGWRRLVAIAGILVPALALVPVAAAWYGFSTPISTQTIAHISNWSQPVLVAVVAVPYLWLRAGPLRSQYFFLLLFLLTWTSFSSVHLLVAGGARMYVAAGALQLFTVVCVAIGVVANIRRKWELKSRPQDVVLLGWTAGVLVFSLIPSTGAVRNFYLLNALMLVVLFYGVARYQILGVDFRLPGLTGRSLKGAIVVPVFFVLLQMVEVEAQNLVGRDGTVAGLLLGSVVSGLLVFFLSRVQTLVGAGQNVPDRDEPLESYDAYRRIEMYRAAMEASLSDGVIPPKEQRMLDRLRDSLGITREEHMALEHDARLEHAKRVVTMGIG